MDTLNIYQTSEPLAYYTGSRQTPQTILITENKDTFYSMRRYLMERGSNQEIPNILGQEIHTLVYGAGKGILRSMEDFKFCVEPYMNDSTNQYLYFGDLDYEGIGIYELLSVLFEEEHEIKPFVAAYEKMLQKTRHNNEFLKQFSQRMKHVGRYAILLQNSSSKTTWKQYGFIKMEEQINLIFAVLLYIMEQSLKEDVCTVDDIGAYIDNLNMQYFEKNLRYDKAVDEIKNVFQMLRIQMQKIQEAMGRIRRNALNYSVTEYETILHENLDTISDTKQKFQNYREIVKARVKEFEEMDLNVKKLDSEEEEKLGNLRIIEQYLNRTIDEHQRILGSHLDLKSLYTHELEQLSQMSLIKRFSFRNDFFDQILEHPEGLGNLDLFLRPLFISDPTKIYNLKKVTELQRPISRKRPEEEAEVMDFGKDEWQRELEKQQREKLAKYEKSLNYLISLVVKRGKIIKKRADLERQLGRIQRMELFADVFYQKPFFNLLKI